jgi:hypothetical protein
MVKLLTSLGNGKLFAVKPFSEFNLISKLRANQQGLLIALSKDENNYYVAIT